MRHPLLASVLFVGCTSLFGCATVPSTVDDGTVDDGAETSDSPASVPASRATEDATGVEQWARKHADSQTVIDGTNAAGELKVRYGLRTETDANGDVLGEVRTNLDNGASLSFRVAVDGAVTIDHNDFPNAPHAVAVAKLALADWASARPNGGLATSSLALQPLDLVKGGSPGLTSDPCTDQGALIIASACIISDYISNEECIQGVKDSLCKK